MRWCRAAPRSYHHSICKALQEKAPLKDPTVGLSGGPREGGCFLRARYPCTDTTMVQGAAPRSYHHTAPISMCYALRKALKPGRTIHAPARV